MIENGGGGGGGLVCYRLTNNSCRRVRRLSRINTFLSKLPFIQLNQLSNIKKKFSEKDCPHKLDP